MEEDALKQVKKLQAQIKDDRRATEAERDEFQKESNPNATTRSVKGINGEIFFLPLKTKAIRSNKPIKDKSLPHFLIIQKNLILQQCNFFLELSFTKFSFCEHIYFCLLVFILAIFCTLSFFECQAIPFRTGFFKILDVSVR